MINSAPKRKLKTYKTKIKHTDKKTLIVYFIIRLLIFGCLVLQIIHNNWSNAFLCLLTLLLITLPTIIEKHLKIKLPTLLETIIILFIFAAEILGEINNFFNLFPHWDNILHTLNGFICAGVGFSLADILNSNSKKINLSPLYLLLVSFSFSMTIGVVWEFCEYGMDKILKTDTQKDTQVTQISSVYLNEEGKNETVTINDIEYTIIYSKDKKGKQVETRIGGYLDIGLNDTIEDLFVNFLGAIIFDLLAYLYIKDKQKYQFVEGFIVRKAKKEHN